MKNGFDKNKITFCTILGVSYYLKNNEFYKLIEKLSLLLARGSSVVFDYPCKTKTKNLENIKSLAHESNNDMKSTYSYDELETRLSKYNFLIYEHLTSDKINNTYFKTYNTLNPENKITAPKDVEYMLITKFN